jgi:cytochrome P450
MGAEASGGATSPSCETRGFDPYDRETLADPYPALRALRGEGRAHRLARPDCWVLAHHADVTAALSDTARFSSAGGNGAEPRSSTLMVGLDPPAHGRVRHPVARCLTVPLVAAIERIVMETAHRVVERACSRPRSDVVGDLAEPIAVATLAALLGLPAQSLETLRNGHAFQATPLAVRWRAFFLEHVRTRRRDGGDDLVSQLAADTRGGRLGSDEIVDVCLLLLVAGWDTPRDLIASAVVDSARLGDELAAAWGDGHAQSLVSELVRYVTPVQSVFRVTTESVTIGAEELPAGARVMLSLASANRDEAVWQDPDRIHPARFADGTSPPHLAFGDGPHACLGIRLARIQLAAVLGALVEQDVRVAPLGEPRWGDTPWFRRMRRGPISVSARA